jgi:beta propeller repeat protein
MRTFATLACAVLLVPGVARGSIVVQTSPVADNGNEQMDGRVSGELIIYTDFAAGTADVLGLRSLYVPLLVFGGPGEQSSGDVDGQLAVCIDTALGARNVLVHDFTTGNNFYVTEFTSAYWSTKAPAISGLSVAYAESNDYSGLTGAVVVMDLNSLTGIFVGANGNGTEGGVSIDGNLVAWHKIENGRASVYAGHVRGATFLVAPGTVDTINRWPSVSGNRIAYVVTTAADAEWNTHYMNLAVYDVSTGQTRSLTNNSSAQTVVKRAKIAGNYVVWSDNRSGDYDIFLYDLETNQEYALLAGPGNQVVTDFEANNQALGGQNIVIFDDDRAGASDVWVLAFRMNQPPVADAGTNQTIQYAAGKTVQLQGTATDPDGDAITGWSWRLASVPTGSTATLSSATAQNPTFAMDQPGDYVLSLTATDGTDVSEPDYVTIHAVRAPVASPTASPTSGPAPLAVQFAANASDPDGRTLTYAWNFGDGEASILANPSHTYNTAGTYVAWLTVSDGILSSPYSLAIAVSPGITMSVATATVTLARKGATGSVSVTADVSAPVPAADDTITMAFDGASLFAAPFSSFSRNRRTGAYTLSTSTATVQIDFTKKTFSVSSPKANLATLDTTNGVEVLLMMGPRTTVQNIPMTATRTGYVYQR